MNSLHVCILTYLKKKSALMFRKVIGVGKAGRPVT